MTTNARFRTMKVLMLATDIAFIAYWLVTAFHALPADWLYRDYTNPILVHWNWSFFPLDIAVSITGLTSLWLARKQRPAWRSFALISLVLTSVSGLQAIAFWVFARDFNLTWWLPNLFLLLYPIFFIPTLVESNTSD